MAITIPERDPMKSLYGDALSGVDELRIILNQLDVEGELHSFTAEQILTICRAVRASGWDIYPGQLPVAFLRHAARTGKFSKRALAYIERYCS